MLLKTHKEIAEIINEIECEKLTHLKFQGIDIWPVIRYHCVSSHWNEVDRKNKFILDQNWSTKRSKYSIQTKIKDFITRKFFERRNCKRFKEISQFNMFFSRLEERKTGIDEKKYNPLAQGWLELFTNNTQCSIYEFDHEDFNQLLLRYQRKNFPIVIENLISSNLIHDIQNSIPSSLIESLRFDLEKIITDIVLILSCRDIFLLLLKKSNVKKVFYTVFYHPYSFALALASQNLGLDSIEIQHGMEGEFSPLEIDYNCIPKMGYNLLPKYFWLWGNTSYERRKCYDGTPHKRFVGGNPTTFQHLKKINREINSKTEKKILFALQPIEEPIPQFIFDLMNNTKYQYLNWKLRMHPRMFDLMDEYLEKFSSFSNVEIKKSSSESLLDSMLDSQFVISCWSTVLYEAASLGIPSIVINKNGKSIMESDIENGDLQYADKKDEFLNIINSLEKIKNKTGYIETNIMEVSSNIKNALSLEIFKE